jgi:PAS domain S-box-containing protein
MNSRGGAALLAELRSYVGLSDADAELLSRFRPVAAPHFRAIADEFYAVVRMHAGAFAVLQDEAQAARLHASMQVWLGDLLSGRYDTAWVERQAHVGEVHVHVGLEPRYVIAAMSRITTALARLSRDASDLDSPALRAAIARVTNVALAILIESYKDHLLGRVERARASQAARLDVRQQILRDALGVADVLVLAFDAGGNLLVANEEAERVSGYAEDELAGADVFALLFAERADEARRTLLAAQSRSSSAERRDVELDVRTRAGMLRQVRWRAASLRIAGTSDADPTGIILVGTHVTRERELERRARKNERLAAAGALAAGLAHEIRNPLNGANLHLAVLDRALARTPDVSPAAREATDVLRAEIRRLGALVTDFLDVARPKPLTRQPCDLNDLARAVGVLLTPEAESRGITLTIEPFALPATARIDGERVKQVLVNLVRNGLEAVKDGGHVAIRVRRLPADVEFDVIDDGPGLPDANAPIFDAFYTTKDRGTGLGLSIVQRIVSDHGGDVAFTSRPGATTFTVRLPADPARSVL